MSHPWYLAAEALPILASLRANPPRCEARRDTYVLTRDDWSRYTGERVDRLKAIYDRELERLCNMDPYPRARIEQFMGQGDAQDVIAAVLGQTLPGIHFLSDFPRLAAIFRNVDAALAAAVKVAA